MSGRRGLWIAALAILVTIVFSWWVFFESGWGDAPSKLSITGNSIGAP